VPDVPGRRAHHDVLTRDPALLARSLDELYREYNRDDSASDPVHLVRPYNDAADREVAGFCAAALAFGRVASVMRSIETLFGIMGPRPAAFVRTFEPSAPHRELRAMAHRWTRGDDLAALLWLIRQMLERSGSLEACCADRASAISSRGRPAAAPASA
jgi:hypothetical protein